MPNPPTNLSLRGFARLIGVDERAVRRAVHTGRLKASVVQTPRGPKIADVALAREEWVANADPGRRLAAGQPVAFEPHGDPIRAAWNAYVDAMDRVEAQLDEVFAAHCRALGYDPEADTPVPEAGLEAWRQLAAADHAAVQAFRRLGDALEAAGVLTFGPARGRSPFEHP